LSIFKSEILNFPFQRFLERLIEWKIDPRLRIKKEIKIMCQYRNSILSILQPSHHLLHRHWTNEWTREKKNESFSSMRAREREKETRPFAVERPRILTFCRDSRGREMWATVATSYPVAPRAMIVADDARAARVRACVRAFVREANARCAGLVYEWIAIHARAHTHARTHAHTPEERD